ncbi:MAG TPA: outer membrane beta-barrel protein [Cyclobacteriaceae bacterium]|nr:outer membrane beta-barrel protein [Cyclobacteriaceae bacterium]HMV09780.1 outer membrane beta-barrel protein [Cyclobacteriaceae bacterium]HMX00510.1 outer membrane beta-barrel protein [Cyclobacteriaceae bacterium]HMX51828.1 outer membrane beta-barrel protein [Cyclobacteriaceae bacterium]HMY94940.1 outer membrane beta-barrel protein [Cyclobacteriaceae bacterium]
MKNSILLLLLFCSFFTISAQENYLPGFVIASKGDTVRGTIDYRNWKRNPAAISFKRESDGLIFSYDPSQIRGFLVAQEYYESARVQTEVSPERTNELSYDVEFILEEEVAFLQALITGNKSLYYLVNKKGKDNFYIKNGDKIDLLLYKQYARNVNYTRQVLINNKYIGQLSNYLGDCTGLQQKTNNVRYSQKELAKLFEAYYRCKTDQPKFKKNPDRAIVQLGLVGGIAISSLKMGNTSKLRVSKADYDNSVNAIGGLSLTLVLPRNQQRFAIQNELLVANYNFTGNDLIYEADDDYIDTEYNFKATQLKLNTMVRIRVLNRQPVSLHLEAGIMNALALSIEAKQTQTTVFHAPAVTTKRDALNARSYEQGFVGGAAGQYGKFSLTARYGTGNGFSKINSLKTTINRFYVAVGYRLTK